MKCMLKLVIFVLKWLQVLKLDVRVTAIETKLGMVEERKKAVADSVREYLAKTVWWFSAAGFSYLLYILPQLLARVFIR